MCFEVHQVVYKPMLHLVRRNGVWGWEWWNLSSPLMEFFLKHICHRHIHISNVGGHLACGLFSEKKQRMCMRAGERRNASVLLLNNRAPDKME